MSSVFDAVCDGLSGFMGAVTGGAYGAGATAVSGSPAVGTVIGGIIQETVTHGWENGVCELPGLIVDPAESLSGGDPAPGLFPFGDMT